MTNVQLTGHALHETNEQANLLPLNAYAQCTMHTHAGG